MSIDGTGGGGLAGMGPGDPPLSSRLGRPDREEGVAAVWGPAQEVLEVLPVAERLPIALALAGYSYREVALFLDQPPDVIARRIRDGLRAVRHASRQGLA